jgi:uncharacterized membrane protein YkvA (DUF1232 family)
MIEELKTFARALKAEIAVLASALRDPRTPLAAKVLGVVVVAYAVSPIDLIPDFIPVLGYLDDLILVALWAVSLALVAHWLWERGAMPWIS